MPDIALTQGLDVQRPLLIIFDKIGDVAAGRSDGLSSSFRTGKTSTSDNNAGHGIDKE